MLTFVEALIPHLTMDDVGDIPFWLDCDDPRPASEQLNEHYQHGGGWDPFKGYVLGSDDSLNYPDDPPLLPIAEIIWGRAERVLIYRYGWVAIIQPDRSFEVSRMD